MENRRSYIKWLMERVKVKDLAELRSANFNENHGAGLLQKYNGSVVEVLNSLNLDRKATEMKPKATPKKYWLPPTFFFPSSSPTLRPFSPFLYPYIVSYICIYILLTLLFRICSKIVEGSWMRSVPSSASMRARSGRLSGTRSLETPFIVSVLEASSKSIIRVYITYWSPPIPSAISFRGGSRRRRRDRSTAPRSFEKPSNYARNSFKSDQKRNGIEFRSKISKKWDSESKRSFFGTGGWERHWPSSVPPLTNKPLPSFALVFFLFIWYHSISLLRLLLTVEPCYWIAAILAWLWPVERVRREAI